MTTPCHPTIAGRLRLPLQIQDVIASLNANVPARSPNLNAYAECWVKSVKEECLARLMLFGERALWQALAQYDAHDHQERNPQGKGNGLLRPVSSQVGKPEGSIQCRERRGGLLKYYY